MKKRVGTQQTFSNLIEEVREGRKAREALDEQVKIEVDKRLKSFLENNPKDRILDNEDVSDEVKGAYLSLIEDTERKFRNHIPMGKSPIIETLERIVRYEIEIKLERL